MKVIVFNNSSLGFVAMEMKAAGYIETGTDLEKPRLCSGRACRPAFMLSVSRIPLNWNAALRLFLRHPGPAHLDVVTNPQELSILRKSRRHR